MVKVVELPDGRTSQINDLSRLLGNIEAKVDATQLTITTLQNSFYTDRDLQLTINGRAATDRDEIKGRLDRLEASLSSLVPIVNDYKASRNKLIGALAVIVFLAGSAGVQSSRLFSWFWKLLSER